MTTPSTLATPPLGRSFLVSSYDRSGGNRDWAVWTESEPDGRITLLDVDGPGYLSRIWCTSLPIEEWAFFIDGEREPRLALSQQELFDGATFPFLPPLAGESGGGRYSLAPIPFARRLRVAVRPERLDPSKRNYFHINYTRLDPDQPPIESWPRELSPAHSNAFASALQALSADEGFLQQEADACLAAGCEATLETGEALEVFRGTGPGRVDALAFRLLEPVGAPMLQQEALRRLRLRAWWDGSSAPSVDVPLGDFFCNPFFPRRFAAYLLGRRGDILVSRLPMPYRNQARIELENRSSAPVRVAVGSRTAPGTDAAPQRYFHAQWNASTRSGEPFRLARCSGPGHYVGCFVTAIGQDGSWNILEGDEFLLPDPGRQPGQYGTGLEDYFNGAYYYTSLFDLPWHGLIEKGAMQTTQYRFHGLDAVDFERELEVGFEFGDQNRSQGYMSSVVYWYADQPRNAELPPSAAAQMARPADRFELPGLMAMLFALERESLWSEAQERCEYLAAKYRDQPWSDLLRLRAAAYLLQRKGWPAARQELEGLSHSTHAPAARQAADLLWRYQEDRNALLGFHIRGRYRLWIDGVEIAEGDSHTVLEVRRLKLDRGTHAWEVELTPNRVGSFFSLCLQSRWGQVTSAGPWEVVELERRPDREPPERFVADRVLPNMTVWQFQPNGYPAMQSGAQCLEVWPFWDQAPRVRRVRLRQSWSL